MTWKSWLLKEILLDIGNFCGTRMSYVVNVIVGIVACDTGRPNSPNLNQTVKHSDGFEEWLFYHQPFQRKCPLKLSRDQIRSRLFFSPVKWLWISSFIAA